MTTKKKPAPRVRKTKAEKRVEIARDVIKQLKLEKFISSPGIYVEIGDNIDGTAELQTALKNVGSCQVCALGGLFLSDIRKNDKCKAEDVDLGSDGSGFYSHYIDQYKMKERLQKLFSIKQMGLIECAYECGSDPEDALLEEEYYNATVFGQRFDDSTERMIAIMKNIIRNKGTFVLPKEK